MSLIVGSDISPSELRQHRLLALNKQSAVISNRLLHRDRQAQEYLLDRGLDYPDCTFFQIGMWRYDVIRLLLTKAGALEWELEAAGINPALEGRITIPLMSPNGDHILGFVGRSVPGDGLRPRYLYPAANQVSRRTHLLGLDLVIASNDDYVVVVEGPFDALMLLRLGVPAVCCHGATITKDQALLLSALGRRIILLADGDNPKEKGRGKTGEQAMRDSYKKHRKAFLPETGIAVCPRLRDPAELAKYSPEILREVIAHPTPLGY